MAANVLNSHSSGEIWALRNSGMSVTENTLLLKNTKTGFSAFGVDPSNGDILVAQCVGTSYLQRLIYTNKVSNLVITQVVQSASSVFISGTGGPSNQSFYLLSSTNIQPPAIWSSTSTGLFDATATFSITNSIEPSSSQGFFRIQVP